MDYAVTQESFDSLNSCWHDAKHNLGWSSVFLLPPWLQVWWQAFGAAADLYLCAVRQGAQILGIAPLRIQNAAASIVGSADVCDYLDFIVAPGREKDFFATLLDNLTQKGVNRLDLESLRPDSAVMTHLVSLARERKCEVKCKPEGVSLELDLPPTWEEYLATLTKKQRHEVNRKLRRLCGTDNVECRCIEVRQGVEGYMETFLKLFSLSREDKANFMTPQMESFFKSLTKAMAEVGLLKFGMVEVNKQPAAMTVGFDYNDTHYLYNSAYDTQFGYLSVGLLCKVLCLKESIEQGKKKWDFLKGGESYKYQLGGREVSLYHCQIIMN